MGKWGGNGWWRKSHRPIEIHYTSRHQTQYQIKLRKIHGDTSGEEAIASPQPVRDLPATDQPLNPGMPHPLQAHCCGGAGCLSEVAGAQRHIGSAHTGFTGYTCDHMIIWICWKTRQGWMMQFICAISLLVYWRQCKWVLFHTYSCSCTNIACRVPRYDEWIYVIWWYVEKKQKLTLLLGDLQCELVNLKKLKALFELRRKPPTHEVKPFEELKNIDNMDTLPMEPQPTPYDAQLANTQACLIYLLYRIFS